MNEILSDWSSFNATFVGACAALGGLIIVAISVNLEKITESKALAARAGASIAVLILGLINSGAALVPGQSLRFLGLEVLLFSAVVIFICWPTTRTIIREQRAAPIFRGYIPVKIGTYLLPTLGYSIGGMLLIAGWPAGLYVSAASTALAICGGVHFTWIALVEVRR